MHLEIFNHVIFLQFIGERPQRADCIRLFQGVSFTRKLNFLLFCTLQIWCWRNC